MNHRSASGNASASFVLSLAAIFLTAVIVLAVLSFGGTAYQGKSL